VERKLIAFILARGGSKRLPGKNTKNFHGFPLIYWTINAAIKSNIFDDVYVSTDDEDIARIAIEFRAKVPFLRPTELATDNAETSDVILHMIDELGLKGSFALLQPTSPLRTAEHIVGASQLFQETKRSVASFCNIIPSSDWLYYFDEKSGHVRKIFPEHPGQKAIKRNNPVLLPNGAIYITSVNAFRRTTKLIDNMTLPYVMDKNVSVDIDTQSDWDLAEALFMGKQ
jgi:CMP-N-acetylneuraminic acid synthetase